MTDLIVLGSKNPGTCTNDFQLKQISTRRFKLLRRSCADTLVEHVSACLAALQATRLAVEPSR